MASATPAKEFVFLVCATVGFSWKTPRDCNFSTTMGQKIFAYGEKISPANEQQNSHSFWLRRPISNQLVNLAHLTEVASLAAEALWGKFFGSPATNPEAEKKIESMEKNLHQKLSLINDCKEVVVHFGKVVEEFQNVNNTKSEIYKTISTPIPVFSIELPQNLMVSLQTLTKDLGELTGEQPGTLKVYVELAIQLEEEKEFTQQANEKIRTLQQELPKTTQQGIESKQNLEQGVETLTPLIEKATPEKRSKIPSEIKSGNNSLGLVKRGLFIFSTTEV